LKIWVLLLLREMFEKSRPSFNFDPPFEPRTRSQFPAYYAMGILSQRRTILSLISENNYDDGEVKPMKARDIFPI
jgi:hypothetical protein